MKHESQSTGRNDPCPCGSGKKYKKCCMLKDKHPARKVREELQEAIKDKVFDSMDDANAFIAQHMEKQNSQPRDDFGGLSPYQMHRLLHFPFDSPDVIRFNFDWAISTPKDSPLLHLLTLIVDFLGEKGLKPTVTGNLPRKTCREIAQLYLSNEEHTWRTKPGDFMSEHDLPDLNIARLTARLAGFIRMYRGKMIASKKCRELIAASNWPALYQPLFLAFVRKLNWAYPNCFIELPFFQHSFAVTLYFLRTFGTVPRDNDFFADRFIAAFPMLEQDLPDSEYLTGELLLKNEYSYQALQSFGRLTGCIEGNWPPSRKTVVVTPLLNRLVTFPAQ